MLLWNLLYLWNFLDSYRSNEWMNKKGVSGKCFWGESGMMVVWKMISRLWNQFNCFSYKYILRESYIYFDLVLLSNSLSSHLLPKVMLLTKGLTIAININYILLPAKIYIFFLFCLESEYWNYSSFQALRSRIEF